ncbi:MAG: agmatinase [Deltaproteobacteria bacterium]
MDTLFNFGGLSREILDKQVPRFSVLPVPYDLTASYVSGMRNGPRAIIEASTHMELYDDELGLESFEAGIETLPFLESTAVGPDKMIHRVQEAADWILDAGRIPVILGGEHSVTLGMVRALLERYPKMSVLQLDAHADMRDSYQGSPYNHACVARRISELCPIVQVGVRSLSIEEAEFMASEKTRPKKSKGIKTWYARDMFGPKGFSLDKVVAGLTGEVCITIDLDCFDPAIMPATGTPEPGGFDWYGALAVLKKVIEKRRVVGFDVVELCPLPGNIAPDFLAAKLVYKIMGYIAYGKGKGPRKSPR